MGRNVLLPFGIGPDFIRSGLFRVIPRTGSFDRFYPRSKAYASADRRPLHTCELRDENAVGIANFHEMFEKNCWRTTSKDHYKIMSEGLCHATAGSLLKCSNFMIKPVLFCENFHDLLSECQMS